eukprot:g1954.t1
MASFAANNFWQPMIGHLGAAIALGLSNVGAAWGTSKAGMGISGGGIMNPMSVMKNLMPVVMAGILGIYGLIVAVLILGNISDPKADGTPTYTSRSAFASLAGGIACGVSGIAAGYAIGLCGDAGARAVYLNGRLYVPLILLMIFAEAIALYGLIVALLLSTVSGS